MPASVSSMRRAGNRRKGPSAIKGKKQPKEQLEEEEVQEVGEEGRLEQRVAGRSLQGDWRVTAESVNSLITNLTQPTTEVSRVLTAVASGDLSEKIALKVNGQPLKGISAFSLSERVTFELLTCTWDGIVTMF